MDDQLTANVEPIEDMIRRLNASSVFGEAIREGDSALVPVANVTYGFGYGAGSGSSPSDEGAGTSQGRGSGAGGGGWAQALGFIRIGPDGVRFEPTMNMTATSVAGIAFAAWAVFWITATIRTIVKRL